MSDTRYGWQTSLDALQRQKASVSSPLVGSKRAHADISGITRQSRESRGDGVGLSLAGKLPPNRISASAIYDASTGLPVAKVAAGCDGRSYPPQTPSSNNPLLSLSNPCYGLPDTLVRNFAALGIASIYPWQASCLMGRGLLDGRKNLVYVGFEPTA